MVVSKQQNMLYYFTEKQYALCNLKSNRIKVSEFSRLNDTFDIFTPASNVEKEHDKAKKFVDIMGGLHAVLCMTSSWNNPLMWAHYADRHHGACIGFEVDISRFQKVQYIKERYCITHFGVQSFDALEYPELKKMMSYKFDAWNYEKEYRHFVTKRDLEKSNGNFFMKFPYWLNPKELILGQRCSLNNGEKVFIKELHARGIKLIKARSAFNTFKIVPKRSWDVSRL